MSTILKDINENINYTFDFKSDISSGETIDSVNMVTGALTLEGSATVNGTEVDIELSGGSANTSVTVSCTVTTSLGGSYVEYLYVTVLDGNELGVSEIDLVRYYSGDTDPDGYIMTDIEISRILYQHRDLQSQHRIYNTLLTSLSQMKALYAQNGFRSRDREVSTEVEEYGAERYQSICDLLDYYKKHPEEIITDNSSSVIPRIKIGGVNKAEYDTIDSNPNSLNGVAKLQRGTLSPTPNGSFRIKK